MFENTEVALMRSATWLGLAGVLILSATASMAQTTATKPGPAKGDRGVALADAPVPRPNVKPCVVTLYADTRFDAHGDPTSRDAKPHEWSYTPPEHCAGAWSKVVLEADFSVNPGRQYDRSVSMWLKGVNLYFGTTQEPDAETGPHWHVEHDVTDYASLFRKPGRGRTILNNWVNDKYTGIIRNSARLVFYPGPQGHKTARPADRVYGLVDAAHAHPVAVENSHETLERTLTLPRNVERAYLDVIAQSQAVDEQWYMCIDDADVKRTRDFSLGPPNAGDPLEQCGNGNHREVAVDIDGQPAGRAPVYPWTYTGGVDPHLWRPTPGIQTLDFTPYRVNLTPFAAKLNDGKPHTVTVRVPGAHHFFSLAANLLIYRDHDRQIVSGQLLQNTLAAQQGHLEPHVQRHFEHGSNGTLRGHVETTQYSDYVITGELATSQGRVVTRVGHQSSFSNRQDYRHPDPATYDQVIDMDTRVTDTTSITTDGVTVEHQHRLHYPLLVDISKQVHDSGAFTADITMKQGYRSRRKRVEGHRLAFWSTLDNSLVGHSRTGFNAGGTAITDSSGQYGHQSYRFNDSLGSCYARRIETRDEAVTDVASGQDCPDHANHLDGRSRL